MQTVTDNIDEALQSIRALGNEEREQQAGKPAITEEMALAFYQKRLDGYGYTAAPDPQTFYLLSLWCARRYLGTVKKGMILYGGTGSGKTTAARTIARLFGTKFVYAKDMPNWYADDDNVPWLERVLPVQYLITLPNMDLILDDAGAERIGKNYGKTIETVREVLEIMYERFKASDDNRPMTIVTTNLDEREFEGRYGARVSSRLKEMCAWIPFKSRDLRDTRKRDA